MNRINKLKVIFIISLIIVVAVVFTIAFLFKNKSKKPISPTPTIPTPYIPEQAPKDILKNSKVTFNLKESDLNFPDQFVLLNQSLNPTLNDTTATQIAKNLDFTSSPIVAEDVNNGTTYIWNNQGSSITIIPNAKTVRYYSSNKDINVADKKLSDESMIKTAEDFLVDKIGLTKDNFKFSNFLYFNKFAGLEGYKTVSKNNAAVIQMNFYPSSSDYPVYTINDKNTVYMVQILKNGDVYYAEIELPGTLSKEQQNHKLLNFQEIKDSIMNSIIISMNDKNVNLLDLGSDAITAVSIESIDLVYLYDKPDSSFLQPIFLFRGKAGLKGEKEEVNISLYLPAISKNP